MVRYTNIIEYPMQLIDDIVDLGGQITRVDRHGEYEYILRRPKASIEEGQLRTDLAAIAAWRIVEWTKWWRMRRNSECCSKTNTRVGASIRIALHVGESQGQSSDSLVKSVRVRIHVREEVKESEL